MKITADALRAKDACEAQVCRFEDLFPNGVEITSELCVQHACSFDWNWAAENLLPPGKYADYEAKYAPLWADYEAKTAPIFAAYKVKYGTLDADYKAKCGAIWADYKAKIAVLFASLAE